MRGLCINRAPPPPLFNLISWSLSWITIRGKMAQITRKCTRLKCRRMLQNLSLSSMLKEKLKRATSSVSGRVSGAPPCKQILLTAREEESFFVCGQDSLAILLQETARGCACGLQYDFDGIVTMDGHVLRTELCCMNGHRIKWASSSILGSKYTANCRWNKLLFYDSPRQYCSLSST